MVLDEGGRVKEVKRNSAYARLLNQRPNALMGGYDLKYKLITQLETKTTALAYIKWDGAVPEAVIPINYSNFEFYPVIGGGYAVKFTDYDGYEYLLNLEDVVVLRKFYNSRDVAGDGNDPLYNTLDMVKASDDGLVEALGVSNKIRGLLRQRKAMLAPDAVKAATEEFTKRFNEASTKGGIIGVDGTEDFTPLNVSPWSTNAAQMREIRQNLFYYFRTPESIVKSSYSEQEGQAWYESVIEPHWQRLSEAFTNVCFTPREYGVGNRILFNGGVLMGTSYQTRVNIIAQSRDVGLLSVNEQRELLGYPPVAGGDKRQVSLNYVNADKQDQYQAGKGESTDGQKQADGTQA